MHFELFKKKESANKEHELYSRPVTNGFTTRFEQTSRRCCGRGRNSTPRTARRDN